MSVLCCTVLATSMSSGAAFADGGGKEELLRVLIDSRADAEAVAT